MAGALLAMIQSAGGDGLSAYLEIISVFSTTSPAYIQFRADGYAYKSENGGSSWTQLFKWKSGAGAAGDYSLICSSVEDPAKIVGTFDSYQTLDATRAYSISVAAGNMKSGNMTVEIVKTSDHTSLASSSASMEVDRT